MFYFKGRKEAREFKSKSSSYKVVDFGSSAKEGKRWAVKFLSK